MSPGAAALTYSWVLIGNAEAWAQAAPVGPECRGIPGRFTYMLKSKKCREALNLAIKNI